MVLWIVIYVESLPFRFIQYILILLFLLLFWKVARKKLLCLNLRPPFNLLGDRNLKFMNYLLTHNALQRLILPCNLGSYFLLTFLKKNINNMIFGISRFSLIFLLLEHHIRSCFTPFKICSFNFFYYHDILKSLYKNLNFFNNL